MEPRQRRLRGLGRCAGLSERLKIGDVLWLLTVKCPGCYVKTHIRDLVPTSTDVGKGKAA